MHEDRCTATFEPLIQVKSEAVDTGRHVSSNARIRNQRRFGALQTYHASRNALGVRVFKGRLCDRVGQDFWRSSLVIRANLSRSSSSSHFSKAPQPTMDTLDNTEWDVLIVGTGLQQSLLALYDAPLRAVCVTQSD